VAVAVTQAEGSASSRPLAFAVTQAEGAALSRPEAKAFVGMLAVEGAALGKSPSSAGGVGARAGVGKAGHRAGILA
jgi:hypothetical protein